MMMMVMNIALVCFKEKDKLKTTQLCLDCPNCSNFLLTLFCVVTSNLLHACHSLQDTPDHIWCMSSSSPPPDHDDDDDDDEDEDLHGCNDDGDDSDI